MTIAEEFRQVNNSPMKGLKIFEHAAGSLHCFPSIDA